MMKEFSLIDVYRNLNPSKLCFTYEAKVLKLSSRIDFFLVSQPLADRVSHLDTLVSIAPDHKAIMPCNGQFSGAQTQKFSG